jgi:hypothetical protein
MMGSAPYYSVFTNGTLWPAGSVRAKAASAAMARTGAHAPILVASPQYYHYVRAFGLWSVRDTSTPFKATIESGLDATLMPLYYPPSVGSWFLNQASACSKCCRSKSGQYSSRT